MLSGQQHFTKLTEFSKCTQDMSVILLSSFGRLFKFKRPSSSGGYASVNGSNVPDGRRGSYAGRNNRGRGDIDEENRLIDQLDEEWED